MDRCILTLVLLILIASGTLYIMQHNKKKKTLEPYKNKCSKPSEKDGDCKPVYQSKTNRKINGVEECRGKLPARSLDYAWMCPYSWYIDSDRGVCENNQKNLAHIRKHGKCPPHNLGPGNNSPSPSPQCSKPSEMDGNCKTVYPTRKSACQPSCPPNKYVKAIMKGRIWGGPWGRANKPVQDPSPFPGRWEISRKQIKSKEI